MNPQSVENNAMIGGAAGGIFWAMLQVVALLSSPSPPSRRETTAKVVTTAFGAISGFWASRYTAPPICAWLHITAVDLVTMVGFAVGGSFWLGAQGVLTVIVAAAPAIARAWLQRLTGVKETGA